MYHFKEANSLFYLYEVSVHEQNRTSKTISQFMFMEALSLKQCFFLNLLSH